MTKNSHTNSDVTHCRESQVELREHIDNLATGISKIQRMIYLIHSTKITNFVNAFQSYAGLMSTRRLLSTWILMSRSCLMPGGELCWWTTSSRMHRCVSQVFSPQEEVVPKLCPKSNTCEGAANCTQFHSNNYGISLIIYVQCFLVLFCKRI